MCVESAEDAEREEEPQPSSLEWKPEEHNFRSLRELCLDFKWRREHRFRSLRELNAEYSQRKVPLFRSLEELERNFKQRASAAARAKREPAVYDRVQLLRAFALLQRENALLDPEPAAAAIVTARVPPPAAVMAAKAGEAAEGHEYGAHAGTARTRKGLSPDWRSLAEEGRKRHAEPLHDPEHCASTAASGLSSERASEAGYSGSAECDADDARCSDVGYLDFNAFDAGYGNEDVWAFECQQPGCMDFEGCLSKGQWLMYAEDTYQNSECFAPGYWNVPSDPSGELELYTGSMWYDADSACPDGTPCAYAWCGCQA